MSERDEILGEYHAAIAPDGTTTEYRGGRPRPEILTTPDAKWRFDGMQFVLNTPMVVTVEDPYEADPELERLIAEEEEIEQKAKQPTVYDALLETTTKAGLKQTAKDFEDWVGGAGLPTRTFDTGATRDTEEGKLDYEGFLSPAVLRRYAEYMHQNRVQSDGSVRDGDNWQKGIPLDVYMKSMWRHFMDVWTMHRGLDDFGAQASLEESLCAVLFNAMGYLHELLKELDES